MKNKEKVLCMIDTALDVSEISIEDTVVGGCSDVADGWIRCHAQILTNLLSDIKDIIKSQEDEF